MSISLDNPGASTQLTEQMFQPLIGNRLTLLRRGALPGLDGILTGARLVNSALTLDIALDYVSINWTQLFRLRFRQAFEQKTSPEQLRFLEAVLTDAGPGWIQFSGLNTSNGRIEEWKIG